ncbi:MAG: sialate O-acetylesterase [Oscillospiraceae bacterium]|nr:sialate O-acetylesterase [Candidatus Equicaccousia limihippi]
MAGRGDLCEAPQNVNTNINVLRNGRWKPLFRPLNQDGATAGYCLAESFANDYAKEHPDVTVGLIPCADGGTTLNQWQPGELLFDNAVYQTTLALRTSTVVGILWHQGENDCSDEFYPLYKKKLSNIVNELRTCLGLHDVPFIAGGLGDFLPECIDFPELNNYYKVNEQLKEMSESIPLFGYVEADGLTCKSDHVHFCTSSLIEFGHRYYGVFKGLEKKNRIFTEKTDNIFNPRSEMEKL